jgi:hypothetical protein
LSVEEFGNLRSQFVISSSGSGYGGRRYAPYVFTEQGVAMLSTVLNSERAVVINIEIMRTFVRVRTLARTQQDLAKQLAELQDKTESLAMSHETFNRNTKVQLREVFETLRELMTPPSSAKRPIGFVHPQEAAKPKTKALKASPAKKAAAKTAVKTGRKK